MLYRLGQNRRLVHELFWGLRKHSSQTVRSAKTAGKAVRLSEQSRRQHTPTHTDRLEVRRAQSPLYRSRLDLGQPRPVLFTIALSSRASGTARLTLACDLFPILVTDCPQLSGHFHFVRANLTCRVAFGVYIAFRVPYSTRAIGTVLQQLRVRCCAIRTAHRRRTVF